MQEQLKSKILCVDDEYINLELFKLAFENDYDVFVAETPFVGLELIKEHNIKIILTDYKMPALNGFEFVKQVKQNYPNVLCVLVTAFIESKMLVESDPNKLIFDYILKPWNYEEVKSVIEKAITLTKSDV